jgi:hypothetical protein
MKPSLIQSARQREALAEELSSIRQASLRATRNNDFRTVGRLTLQAMRINESIAEAEVNAELASR